MSDTVTILKCRICGKLMKRNAYQVYTRDRSCCLDCNREADEEYSPYSRIKNANTFKALQTKETEQQ